MQWIVKAMAWDAKGDGGERAESFERRREHLMGQTEAPLTIKPFIAGLTESDCSPS